MMHTDDVATTLAATKLGAGLDPGALRRLSGLARPMSCPDGTTLISAGTACPYLGLVVDGRIALRTSIPGRGDLTLMTLDRGDVFGWSAAVSLDATSTVVAMGDTTVLLLDREPLLRALETDVELAAAVYHQLLSVVAKRLVATRLQLLDLYRGQVDPW